MSFGFLQGKGVGIKETHRPWSRFKELIQVILELVHRLVKEKSSKVRFRVKL